MVQLIITFNTVFSGSSPMPLFTRTAVASAFAILAEGTRSGRSSDALVPCGASTTQSSPRGRHFSVRTGAAACAPFLVVGVGWFKIERMRARRSSPGQTVHVEDAGLLVYVPAVHIEQAEDSTPVAELTKYLPAGQSEQDAEADPLYWPTLQLQK